MKKILSLLSISILFLASCGSDDEDNNNHQAAVSPWNDVEYNYLPVAATGDTTRHFVYRGISTFPCQHYPINFREYRGITVKEFAEAKNAGKLADLGEPTALQTELTGDLENNLFKITGPWFVFEVTEPPYQEYKEAWNGTILLMYQQYAMRVRIAPNTSDEKRLLVFDLKEDSTIRYRLYRPYDFYFFEQDAAEKDDE